MGGNICSTKIFSIQECMKLPWDRIVITSAPGLDSIKSQLIDLGIDELKIDDSYVIAPIESRRIFLEKLAELQSDMAEDIAVAEAGVFEGDFAKWINFYYPNRKLYLFDTFSGFDVKDIKKEFKMSKANVGDYANTSVELVLSKMRYKHNCKIYKGYFRNRQKKLMKNFAL